MLIYKGDADKYSGEINKNMALAIETFRKVVRPIYVFIESSKKDLQGTDYDNLRSYMSQYSIAFDNIATLMEELLYPFLKVNKDMNDYAEKCDWDNCADTDKIPEFEQVRNEAYARWMEMEADKCDECGWDPIHKTSTHTGTYHEADIGPVRAKYREYKKRVDYLYELINKDKDLYNTLLEKKETIKAKIKNYNENIAGLKIKCDERSSLAHIDLPNFEINKDVFFKVSSTNQSASASSTGTSSTNQSTSASSTGSSSSNQSASTNNTESKAKSQINWDIVDDFSVGL